MRSIEAEFTVTHARSLRRHEGTNGGITLLLAIVVLCSSAAAVAAGVAHHRNAQRAERYAHDSACRAGMTVVYLPDFACSLGTARVTSRWTRTFRSSRSYELALRDSLGVVDSVTLAGVESREVWSAALPGSELRVLRFAESGRRPTNHVVLLAAGDRAARTTWNPEWRSDDAEAGVVGFCIIAAGASIASIVLRRRQTRNARTSAAIISPP